MRERPMITKTLYDAFKYLKYWREHGMVCHFEVTYSCLCILAVKVTGLVPQHFYTKELSIE